MLWNGTRLLGLCLVPGYTWGGCAESKPCCGDPRAAGWRISPISPTSPKDFLEAQELLQTMVSAGLKCPGPGLVGAWAWSTAGSLPLGCSSNPLCMAKSFWGAPWWFAWMYGQEAGLGEVLWCCRRWPCLDRTACASSLFPGLAAKAPEQLFHVNSLVFWQFCTITSCLYQLSQTVSASVSSPGFLLLPVFLENPL